MFKLITGGSVPLIVTGRSRSGLHTLAEGGGGLTNRGGALVIATPSGEKPKAIYIYRKGHLACNEHAVVPVRAGYHVVHASRYRDKVSVTVYKITEIKVIPWEELELKPFCFPKGDHTYAVLSPVWEGTVVGGQVPEDVPANLRDAVAAAAKKAQCYHCRQPHYVIEPTRKKTA